MIQRKKIDNFRRCTLFIRLRAMLQMYYFETKKRHVDPRVNPFNIPKKIIMTAPRIGKNFRIFVL